MKSSSESTAATRPIKAAPASSSLPSLSTSHSSTLHQPCPTTKMHTLQVPLQQPQNVLRMPYSLDPGRKRESMGFPNLLTAAGYDTALPFRRATDPLVHYGRHFGRSIHALCNVHALIINGIIRIGEHAEEPDEEFTAQYVDFCLLMGLYILTKF